MPEWIIAMFLIGALLSAGDMAKIFFEARRSRREAAVYDNHPQKLQMEHYADSFRVLAESFYQMPAKSVMPEACRVDKILAKEQQEVCSRCAKASWCWEQYGNLTRERCQELLQTIADGDEDEISRARGEWNVTCLNGSRFPESDLDQYKQIVKEIPKDKFLLISRATSNYIFEKMQKMKQYKSEPIKKLMRKKMLKGKEFIHSEGLWNDFLKYLSKEMTECLT